MLFAAPTFDVESSRGCFPAVNSAAFLVADVRGRASRPGGNYELGKRLPLAGSAPGLRAASRWAGRCIDTLISGTLGKPLVHTHPPNGIREDEPPVPPAADAARRQSAGCEAEPP